MSDGKGKRVGIRRLGNSPMGGGGSARLPRGQQMGWSLTASPQQLLRIGVISATAQAAALLKSGRILVRHWKKVLSTPGRGKTYDTYFVTTKKNPRKVVPHGKRPKHRASAPGDAPAVDFGASRASIGLDVKGHNHVRVGTDRLSLLYLEYGVQDHPGGIKIAPRPHKDRAMRAAKDEMTFGIKSTFGKVPR